MINALFSSSTKMAPVSKTRAWTRGLDFYDVNRQMAGLPHFMMVDTPGLGHAEVQAAHVKHHPDLIYTYLSRRQALKHVFHLCDARNKRLLPADKQLIHLLASAQRRRVRYTIVVTKIDVVTRKLANLTAENIRAEIAPYCDVDIMFASAKNHRGVDHLWAKIWQSVTETPRGRRHSMFGLPRTPLPETPEDFDSQAWEDDHDFQALEPGEGKDYFDDKWGEDLNEKLQLDESNGGGAEGCDDSDDDSYDHGDDLAGEFEDSFGGDGDEVEFEKRWEATTLEAS